MGMRLLPGKALIDDGLAGKRLRRLIEKLADRNPSAKGAAAWIEFLFHSDSANERPDPSGHALSSTRLAL